MRNVRISHQNQSFYFFKLTFFFGFWLVVLTGCASPRETVCNELPLSRTEIAAFKAELDSRFIGRRIASTSKAKAARVVPDGAEVAAWMDWTERTLKRTQWARDAIEDDKSKKKALPLLNEAGLSLVSLHGFLEQKKWHKAYKQLDKVEENLMKVSTLVCVPTKQEADREPSAVESSKKKKSKNRK